MRVGAVSETVTVSGEAPVVDVTSARSQETISGETVNAHPDVPTIWRPHCARPVDQRAGQRRRRRPGRHLQRVPDPRRTPERRAGPGRRHERRLPGHGRVLLRHRGRQCAGSGVQPVWRPWRGEHRRPADEHHRQAGREQVCRDLLHQRHGQRIPGHEPDAGAAGQGPDHGAVPGEGVGYQPRIWRPDYPRQAVVLRHVPLSVQRPECRQHVGQPECRRSDQVDVSPRRWQERPAAGSTDRRRQVEERLSAVYMAGDAEKQDQLFHGLPADLPALHPGWLQFRAHVRRHDCLTRSAAAG